MPISNYGPLELPIPVPADDATVADPLVDTIFAFFVAILNANGAAAWATRGGYQPGGNDAVVVSTFSFDPEDEDGTVFNARDLPALFMWRSEVEGSEWLAADYYIRKSKLVLLWVPPPFDQEDRSKTRPFINAICSIIDGVTDPDGRDPAYIVPDDDDPAASYLGSLIWKQLPQLFSFDVGKSKPSRVKIKIDSREQPHFPCVRMEIDIRERNTTGEPPDAYFSLDGADITISDAHGGPEPGPDDLTVSLGFPFTGMLGSTNSLPASILPGSE